MSRSYFTQAVIIVTFFITMCLSAYLGGCASDEDPLKAETALWSASEIYNSANQALSKKNYTRAINLYKILETTYPYGTQAEKGLLNLAYACYA
jgi:outer membrane protein assembly factor BamD (BamD/ComL family)